MKAKSDNEVGHSKLKANSLEIEELKSQLARALADYDNLRKRTETERQDIEKFVSLRLILRLLSVFDTLESAQKHLKDQGLAIAINEFKKVLNEEGLEEIRPEKGEKFDHNVHEAIESVSGEKSGEIAELVLPGWKFTDGHVVRVAKVKAYKGK